MIELSIIIAIILILALPLTFYIVVGILKGCIYDEPEKFNYDSRGNKLKD